MYHCVLWKPVHVCCQDHVNLSGYAIVQFLSKAVLYHRNLFSLYGVFDVKNFKNDTTPLRSCSSTLCTFTNLSHLNPTKAPCYHRYFNFKMLKCGQIIIHIFICLETTV